MKIFRTIFFAASFALYFASFGKDKFMQSVALNTELCNQAGDRVIHTADLQLILEPCCNAPSSGDCYHSEDGNTYWIEKDNLKINGMLLGLPIFINSKNF